MNVLTKAEAAAKAKISVKQLIRLIKKGELPVISLGDTIKGDRISEQDLNNYLIRQKRNRGASCPSRKQNVVPISSASKSVDAELAELFGATTRKRGN